MEESNVTVISDRLLDVIRLARVELKAARPRYMATPTDGKLDALIEHAADSLFDVLNVANAHGVREVSGYDMHLQDDCIPGREIAVELHELTTPRVAAAPEPE